MTQLYNPNLVTAQPAAAFNGLNFDSMSTWGQLPINYGVNSATPLTSGYTFNGINPNRLSSFGTVNLDGAQLYQSPMGGPAVGASGPASLFDSALQNKRLDGTTSGGWLTAGLGVAQGLGSLYLGMEQYKLAKETLAANKLNADRNYAAQRKTINSQLEDRQRARVASNAGAYQSVSEYMNENRVR
jgi:hypothetical protein